MPSIKEREPSLKTLEDESEYTYEELTETDSSYETDNSVSDSESGDSDPNASWVEPEYDHDNAYDLDSYNMTPSRAENRANLKFLAAVNNNNSTAKNSSPVKRSVLLLRSQMYVGT